MKSLRVRSILAFLAVVLLSAPAWADWRLCNKTGYPVEVSIGYYKDGSWWSEGWWKIEPGGRCATVISGDLTNRHYYYMANHLEIGGGWYGDYTFCVTTKAFTIRGDSNCEGRGYRTQGFLQADSEQARNMTTNLTD